MVTGIKKIYFNFPLKLLLFVGKWQGLIVFTNENTPVISYKRSPFLCAYSNIYTVLIVTLLHLLAIEIFMAYPMYQVASKSIVVIVYITEQGITAFRVITVYIVLFYYRNRFRSIVVEATYLHQSITKLMNGGLIFCRSLYRCYFSKVAGVFFQLACILNLMNLYKRIIAPIFQSHMLKFTMVIYMHFTTITISSLFYAGMMFILMFYENLNRKALQISKSIKVVQDKELNRNLKYRLNRRLSDEVDQIVFLYDRVFTFTRNFNKIFSLQLLFTLLNAFTVVLVELFYIYDNVRQIYSKPELRQFLSGHIIKDLTFVLYYAVELYHSVSISNAVIKQANNTGWIFRTTLYGINVRLQRSIELLSLPSLIELPTVTACRLFEMNSTILFGTVATIASYLLIFIQFDINDLSTLNTTTYFYNFSGKLK